MSSVAATAGPGVEARFEALLLDFLSYLEFERGLSRNTLSAYRTDLLQYGAFLAGRGSSPLKARRADVADFLAELARGNGKPPCGAATLNRKTACLRSFYDTCAGRADRRRSDGQHRPPRKGRTLPKVLSYSEVKRLLESVSGSEPADLRDRALLEVMYGCGLRASETIGLEAGSIDLRAASCARTARAPRSGSCRSAARRRRGQALPALGARGARRRIRRARPLPQPPRRGR